MPVDRKVDEVHAMRAREPQQQRREQPAMECEAVQEHQRRALTHALDVKHRGGWPRCRCSQRAHAAAACRNAVRRRSTSAAVCAAVSDTRSRAVPTGTVGGRIAGTKILARRKLSDSATARASSSTISGWIGESEAARHQGRCAAPARNKKKQTTKHTQHTNTTQKNHNTTKTAHASSGGAAVV